MTRHLAHGGTETWRVPPPTRPSGSTRQAYRLEVLLRAAGISLTVLSPIVFAALVVIGVNNKNTVTGAVPSPAVVSTPYPSAAATPVDGASAPAPARDDADGRSPAPDETADPQARPQVPIGAGEYRGGRNVAVGRYVTEGPDGTDDGCRYELAVGPDGTDVVASDDNVTGRTTITVWRDEYLVTRGCLPWAWIGPPRS